MMFFPRLARALAMAVLAWLLFFLLSLLISDASAAHQQIRVVGSPELMVAAGTSGKPVLVSDVTVLDDGDRLHMFYGAFFCFKDADYYFSWDPADPLDCDLGNVITAIGYAYSTNNGTTWSFRARPVLYPGAEDEWDDGKIETPTVMQTGGTTYLCYSGCRDTADGLFRIGCATLDTSKSSLFTQLITNDLLFTRDADNPLIPGNASVFPSDNNNTQEPSIFLEGSDIALYYSSLAYLAVPSFELVSVGSGRATLATSGLTVSGMTHRIVSAAASGDGSTAPIVGDTTEVKKLSTNRYVMLNTTGVWDEIHEDAVITYRESVNGVSQWGASQTLIPVGVAAFDNWGVYAPMLAVGNPSYVYYTAIGWENHVCDSEGDGRFCVALSGSRAAYTNIARVRVEIPASFRAR